MKPGRSSGKARRRRIMAAARLAVKQSWDGWDLADASDPAVELAEQIERPPWSRWSKKDPASG